MQAPLFSTITLIMELAVAALIFRVIFQSRKNNSFPGKLALFTVVYEILLNVGYMIYRVVSHPATYSSAEIKIVGAAHGILSLIMMHAVMLLFLAAWRKYRTGVNFFLDHPLITRTFLFFWAISLLSGVYLYWRIYFG